jgi:hypothetical protein
MGRKGVTDERGDGLLMTNFIGISLGIQFIYRGIAIFDKGRGKGCHHRVILQRKRLFNIQLRYRENPYTKDSCLMFLLHAKKNSIWVFLRVISRAGGVGEESGWLSLLVRYVRTRHLCDSLLLMTRGGGGGNIHDEGIRLRPKTVVT